MARSDLIEVMSIVEPVVKSVEGKQCVADSISAKVSLAGTDVQNTAGYAGGMFHSLGVDEQGIQGNRHFRDTDNLYHL